MADVGWVRLSTRLFENRKIKYLLSQPKGAELTLLWVRLLCLAGTINDNGRVYVTSKVTYTPQTLAVDTGVALAVVKKAWELFQDLEMIEITEEGHIEILGWEKHQNVTGLEKLKEDAKIRQRRSRFKKVGLEYEEGMQCAYCGEEAVTVDHIIPKSKGGKDVATNVVPCCKLCNNTKNNRDVVDFLNAQLASGGKVDVEHIGHNSILAKYVNYNVTSGVFEAVSHVTNGVTNGVTNETITHQSRTREEKNKNKNRKEDDSYRHHLLKGDDDGNHTEIFALWEKNIMPLVPAIAEKLQALLGEVGEAAVEQGILAAVEHGARNFSYVQTVARNYVSGKGKPQKEEMPF